MHITSDKIQDIRMGEDDTDFSALMAYKESLSVKCQQKKILQCSETRQQLTRQVALLFEQIMFQQSRLEIMTQNIKQDIKDKNDKIKIINIGPFDTVFKRVGNLTNGQSFGERALMSGLCFRAATITAEGKCYVGVLEQCDFNRCIRDHEMKHKEELIDFISSVPQFKSLSKMQATKIFDSLNPVNTFKN